mgnify:CR=1 FL=1
MANENVHSGHRARMRKKFLDNGIDSFEVHEVLELLLFYAVPMKNTSEIAHKLLDAFGSISAVFDAPFDALVSAGLTETQAVMLKLIPDVTRLYIDDKHNNKSKILDFDNVADKILRKFIGRENENVLLLLIDAKGKEVFCGIVSKGSLVDATFPIRKIVDFALRYNAKSVIVAHNHPSGLALPSRDDIDATINLKNALELIGVRLLDHYIVADNDCVSIAQSGILPTVF